MPYLVALVIVVGVLCLVDLLLTVGVIRRLREHTQLLAAYTEREQERRAILPEGETADRFETVATDGSPISRERLAEPTLIGFFSPDCGACQEALPGFVTVAERFRNGRGEALAVIVTPEGDAAPQRELLEPVARVVVERPGGPVSSALGVHAFPSFGLLGSGGRVLASGLRLDRVITLAEA